MAKRVEKNDKVLDLLEEAYYMLQIHHNGHGKLIESHVTKWLHDYEKWVKKNNG